MLELLLPNSAELILEAVQIDQEVVTLRVKSKLLETACPICQQKSAKVQSHYSRTLAELPFANYAVKLQLCTRRFFCPNPSCQRRIFAERFNGLVKSYARRTLAQAEKLTEIAFKLGGEAGAELATKLHLKISGDTLLRLIRQESLPKFPTPQILGVDDWAKKKGQTYGTILVDLASHQVVDLLEDRTAETLETWLKSHPGVAVISRDRATAYAEGAKKGAPEALQVADRFHLLVNLRHAVEESLYSQTLVASSDSPKEQPELNSAKPPQVSPAQPHEPAACQTKVDLRLQRYAIKNSRRAQEKQASRERRQTRYQQLAELHQQGYSQGAIARHLRMHHKTVKRWLVLGTVPELAERAGRASVLDPYKPYLERRWLEGQRNVKQLCREVRKQGYKGCNTLIYDYVRSIKPEQGKLPKGEKPPSLKRKQAAWLMVSDVANLSLKQIQQLSELVSLKAEIANTYCLAQEFTRLLRERDVDGWGGWLEAVEHCGVPQMVGFKEGLLRDEAAVKNAMLCEISNKRPAYCTSCA